MVPGRLVRLSPGQVNADGRRLATREWTAVVHTAAAQRLAWPDRSALVTGELARAGTNEPIDVWHYFNLNPEKLDNLWCNGRGIEETAVVCSPPVRIVNGHLRRPAWSGFQDVEAPGSDGSRLFARLGQPEPSREIPGSYVVITHGLFGTLDGADMENQVQALRAAGHHVLALEMRGHGETLARHPEYSITFGIAESADLLSVARWLKAAHGATRVGLVSFSLTAHEALLTAWLDGTNAVHEFDADPILKNLPRREAEPAFNGGMLMVSAVIGAAQLGDRFDVRYSLLDAPAKASFQQRVAQRLADYHEPAAYSMWDLAKSELRRAGYLDRFTEAEVRQAFMKLVAAPPEVEAERLENVRVPTLLLSAANDPLATAQNVAAVFARVHNPNIGVILLKEGGHMGFPAMSADYYYSVMLNFFDPMVGPGR